MVKNYPWIVYVLAPSAFECQRCGSRSLYVLPKTIQEFIVHFRWWAIDHFNCQEAQQPPVQGTGAKGANL